MINTCTGLVTGNFLQLQKLPALKRNKKMTQEDYGLRKLKPQDTSYICRRRRITTPPTRAARFG